MAVALAVGFEAGAGRTEWTVFRVASSRMSFDLIWCGQCGALGGQVIEFPHEIG